MELRAPRDWNKKTFAQLFDFSGGFTASRNDLGSNGVLYLHYGDIHTASSTLLDIPNQYEEIPKIDIPLEDKHERYLLKDGDIAFVDASEDFDGVSKFFVIRNPDNLPLLSGLHTIVAKDKTDLLDNSFKKYIFQNYEVRKQFMILSAGQKVKGINQKNINKIQVPLPPIKEQKQIADILSTWDRAIELKDKLINKKTELLDATIQRYKRKLFKSIDFDTWTKTMLKKVFSVRKEKDYESEEQPLYSFTIENGVSPKTDRYNRSFLVKGDKKYKVTKFNDLVYNPANLKYGAISVNKNPDSVLISPIYETLYVKDTNKYDIDFFKYFLTTSEMISYYKSKVEGTLVERSAVKVDQFLLFTIDVPEYNVQKRVTNHLNTIDKSIDILKRQKEMLELQKKGLMQRLLTGQLRVQV